MTPGRWRPRRQKGNLLIEFQSWLLAVRSSLSLSLSERRARAPGRIAPHQVSLRTRKMKRETGSFHTPGTDAGRRRGQSPEDALRRQCISIARFKKIHTKQKYTLSKKRWAKIACGSIGRRSYKFNVQTKIDALHCTPLGVIYSKIVQPGYGHCTCNCT